MPDPFSIPIRVYWEDTDAGGVVYHASYVRFLERARTEWLRARGIGQRQASERDDLVLAIRAMQLDFLKPARLDDELRVTVDTVETGRASLAMRQSIFHGDQRLLAAHVRVVSLVASTFRPRALPEWLATTDSCLE